MGLSNVEKSKLIKNFMDEHKHMHKHGAETIVKEIKRQHGISISPSAIYKYFKVNNITNPTGRIKRGTMTTGKDEVVHSNNDTSSSLLNNNNQQPLLTIDDILRAKQLATDFGGLRRLQEALDQLEAIRRE